MRGADVEEDEKASDQDVVDYLKEQRERSGLSLEDFVSVIWEGLVVCIKWTESNAEVQALKEVKVSYAYDEGMGLDVLLNWPILHRLWSQFSNPSARMQSARLH